MMFILSDVSVYSNKMDAAAAAALAITPIPAVGEWAVIATATCAAGSASGGTVIGAGQDATVILTIGIGTDGTDAAEENIKIGRPIFVKLETSSGNIFVKQLVNGRQVG